MTRRNKLTTRQKDVLHHVCYGPVVFYKKGYKPHEALIKKSLVKVISDPIGVLDILRPTDGGKSFLNGYGGY